MRKLFNYLYYRYANFYKNWGDGTPYRGGYILLFIAIQAYSLTIINVIFHVFKIQMPENFVICFTIPMMILAIMFSFVFDSKKKYEKLHEVYKDEENKKRKIIFAWLFLVVAILLYVFTLICIRVNS